VTREQALKALSVFLSSRLDGFGPWQDAMWTHTPYGWHSLLSTSLNLHLITPLEVVRAAEQAYRAADLSLPSAEGFIRQILGWREFIRGVYWLDMPGMASDNFFGHQRPLPAWFWTGQTRMACMKDAIGQTLEHGYAHHIQRLMVTGNFSLLAQLSPQAVASWYLAVYVDAVEWVELPNVAGMALFANGGRFTSKPYIASGAYTKRMSNYCSGCVYDPAQRVGPKACPVTTLYWNFLDVHEAFLAGNPRTALMAKNIQRLSPEDRQAIRDQASQTLSGLDAL
jgi:deoxyribodipyrimidine photolyase-related protein